MIDDVIVILLFKVSIQVYLIRLLWHKGTLAIYGPPAADQTLVMRIDSDLWNLTHFLRRIAFYKTQYLLILQTFLLFVILVSYFYDFKRKILVINFFFIIQNALYVWF